MAQDIHLDLLKNVGSIGLLLQLFNLLGLT